MNKDEIKLLENISKKLNVLISLSIRNLLNDSDFSKKRKRGFIGDVANYLRDAGIDYGDIADILGAPSKSVRELIRLKKGKKRK